jgi:hypothetical protein
VYVLDPMLDDFAAPKADRALTPDTVEANALWQHIQAIRRTGHHQPGLVCPPDGVDAFLERLAEAEGCLAPNADQRAFIRALDRALVPLQGPPGTGKTSGAIAPALLGRAFAAARAELPLFGVVVAPSHEAVDAVLEAVTQLLADWRDSHHAGGASGTAGDADATTASDTSGVALATLDLVRVVPTTAPEGAARVDAATPAVDVTYCNYHNAEDAATLVDQVRPACTTTPSPDDENPRQCLLFVTPATLYRALGVLAEGLPAIDGTTAPAAMRDEAGLADVLCVDEASMLDLPRLLLAGSILQPAGQTRLSGFDGDGTDGADRPRDGEVDR